MKQIFSGINDILEKSIKTFIFFWLLLCIYRIVFIAGMSEYLEPNSGISLVGTAIYSGAKLSLQTAGAITLFMLIGIIAEALWHSLRYFRAICSFLAVFATTLLFVARFPFYHQFHSGFNQMLFTAMHDDMYALFMSLVDEFQLPLKMAFVLVLAFAINLLYSKWLRFSFKSRFNAISRMQQRFSPKLRFSSMLLAVYLLGTLSLYGGGWSWRTGVNWENAGITDDNFLNESILDDYQAIYRAYANQSRMEACNGLNFSAQDVRNLAASLTGKQGGSDMKAYLEKTAPGAKIDKPKHIFIIVSESYANWPLLDKYKDLHIADGMKSIIARDDTFYSGSMLPSGSATVSALMTMTTGLANSNLYLTTMPEALAQPYLTAFAPQMKKLGYHTSFWYSGPATWENIQDFTLAQGFDDFYSRGSIDPNATGSVWGADDEYLYDAVGNSIDDSQPTFTMILNTSNHSPFNIDLAAKGFDAEMVRQALPENERGNEDLVRELGHYWYADKQASEFIKKMQAKYPDSLFIMIGDHADRYNIEKKPSMYERYAIPFIMTGRGVTKDMLPSDMAGSQTDIMPTLIDAIAPQGFTYYSVGRDMADNKLAQNYAFWLTADAIGKTDDLLDNPEFYRGNSLPDATVLDTYINGVRAVSWWVGKYGDTIDEALLEQDR